MVARRTALALLVSAAALGACREPDPMGPDDLAGLDLIGVDLALPPGVDGAMPVKLDPTTSLTIVMEPGDSGAMLLSAINGATTSVHMTMYQLTAQSVVDALIARKAAGKEVKVVLNKDFPNGMGSNAAVYTQLQNGGVQVTWAPTKFQYTHQKTVLIDSSTAIIMTMNASVSAFTDNREILAFDTDAADVAEAEAIFQADFTGGSTNTTGKLITAPDNAEARLIALVDKAVTTLDIEGEVFSADSLLQAVGRAQKRGVAIRVVLSDQTPTNAQAVAVMGMKQVGIPVKKCATPYIHSKAIVVDGTLAYAGSENFTANSLENNRELGVLVGKKSEVDKISAAISADFAAGTNL